MPIASPECHDSRGSGDGHRRSGSRREQSSATGRAHSSSGRPRSHSSEIASRSASRTTRSRLRRNCGSSRGSSTRRASTRARNSSSDGAVAPVAVDLPVRRHRAEVHDAGVGPRRLVRRRHSWAEHRSTARPVSRDVVSPDSVIGAAVADGMLQLCDSVTAIGTGSCRPLTDVGNRAGPADVGLRGRVRHDGQGTAAMDFEHSGVGGRHGHGVDGRGQLPAVPAGHVLPERRGRRRQGPQDLRRLPGHRAVPRVRPRAPHRPRRVGRVQRARAAPHPQAASRSRSPPTDALGDRSARQRSLRTSAGARSAGRCRRGRRRWAAGRSRPPSGPPLPSRPPTARP